MHSEPFKNVFPLCKGFPKSLSWVEGQSQTGQMNPHDMKKWDEVSKVMGSEAILPPRAAHQSHWPPSNPELYCTVNLKRFLVHVVAACLFLAISRKSPEIAKNKTPRTFLEIDVLYGSIPMSFPG